MPFWWTIALPVRYVYKRGMTGSDIAALQANLGIPIDGDFGPDTEVAVIAYQTGQFGKDDADGIAGPRTNQRICVQRFRAASDKYDLPRWLLKSFASSESNFLCGTCARHPSDPGWDVGGLQMSSGTAAEPSQDFLRRAYDLAVAADVTGEKARELCDGFPNPAPSRYLTELAHGDKAFFRWAMVCLNHNWPYAAHWIPRRGHIYEDPTRDDQFAQWVSTASAGRLTTPRQWVSFQVEAKTVYA
jgi:hypothetical protein